MPGTLDGSTTLTNIINKTVEQSLGIAKTSSFAKSWWNKWNNVYYRATKHNHQNVKKSKKHLQQLINSAKTKQKCLTQNFLTLLKQQFYHKLTGNKTINIRSVNECHAITLACTHTCQYLFRHAIVTHAKLYIMSLLHTKTSASVFSYPFANNSFATSC